MRQTTKRFLSMVLAVVFIMGSAIVYFDFIQPEYASLEDIRRRQLGQEQTLQIQQGAISQVKKLMDTYQQEEQFQQAVSAALPVSLDVAGIMAGLNGAATADHVQLSNISLLSPGVQNLTKSKGTPGANLISPVNVYVFQMRVNGSYENLKRFLEDLETNVRIMDVQELAIAPLVKPDIDLFAADLKFAAYYQSNQLTPGASSTQR